MKKFFTNKKVLFILGIFFILLLWLVLSLLFDKNSMIFPSPIESFKSMIGLLGKKTTYEYLGFTLLRMVIGFAIAFALALVIGIFAGHNENIYTFLKPLMNVLKSVPTVSFVFLFVVIFQPRHAPAYVVILVSLPILFESVVTGIKKTDPDVIQAARVDGANKFKEIIHIRLPLASSYILVGISSSLAMSFKVEIMAEVLTGMTRGGIGSAILGVQQSEITLTNIFGYTLIVIVVVLLFTALSEHLKKVFINK